MATTELVLLPSSPQWFSGPASAMSSSPEFPLPNAIVSKKTKSKSGNGDCLIPKRAILSNSSAAIQIPSSPLKARRNGPNDIIIKRKEAEKPLVDKEGGGREDVAPKKMRKPREKKSVVGQEDATVIAKPARKPRAKKDDTGGQSKIKAKVTKASTGLRVDKADGKRKTETVSSHFVSEATGAGEDVTSNREGTHSLMLKEAVKRRVNWTPPPTIPDSLDVFDTPVVSGVEATCSSASVGKQKTITDIFENFSYSKTTNVATSKPILNESNTRKRKLIELVKTNATAIEQPLPEVKTVKKKPRTITELAISAYATTTHVKEDMDNPPAPILQYFPSKVLECENSTTAHMKGTGTLGKSRSRIAVKKSTKCIKSKKGTADEPLLLSPVSALKRVSKQEFVFGTSSQLAREESPTLLRDLQQAMQASNEVDDDPFAVSFETVKSLATGLTETVLTGRNLWAAAWKGVESGISGTEIVDLSESPVVFAPKELPPPVLPESVATVEKALDNEEVWHELDEDASPSNQSANLLKVATSIPPMQATMQLNLSKTSARMEKCAGPTSSNLSKSAPNDAVKSSNKTISVQKPNYEGYSTAQLAKEITMYRFKPVKGRDKMIALLEKCWEGKQRVALGNPEASEPLSKLPAVHSSQAKESERINVEAEAPKKLVGRPRKNSGDAQSPNKGRRKRGLSKPVDEVDPLAPDSDASLPLRQTPVKPKSKHTTAVEEIYDSDVFLTPSTPRRRKSQVGSPPLPLQLSTSSEVDEDSICSPTSQQVKLHEHITRAVVSGHPSTDPSQPSWHEKILLYDPIVLEDLARWLNTGALGKVGWDGEVAPSEVKRWCLEKSICCLWRENLKGGPRRHY